MNQSSELSSHDVHSKDVHCTSEETCVSYKLSTPNVCDYLDPAMSIPAERLDRRLNCQRAVPEHFPITYDHVG